MTEGQIGISDRRIVSASIAKLFSFSMMCVLSAMVADVNAGQFANSGEILFTDSSATVLRADIATAKSAVVTTGQKLMQPFGIAVGRNGEYFVSDTGCLGLLGVNPATGEQRLIACGGILGIPFGIAVEANGMILVANGSALVRVSPNTGAQSILASGGHLQAPIAVAVADNGSIFVVEALGAIVRVEPQTGAQKLITSGKYLQRPQGIAVSGNSLYVTDVATSDMNFGVGRIIQINANSGHQRILAESGNLVSPVGITVHPDGDLIVGDPYTMNPGSVDVFDGAIIRVDRLSGQQTPIARGSQSFVNPRCVVVVLGTGSNVAAN
jgi:hypothetical protein